MSDAASFAIARSRAARRCFSAPVDPEVLKNPSADSRFFDKTPNPFVAFPAPGAAAIDVLSFTVPAGFGCIVRWLAIVAIVGGFTEGSGNVVWRVLVNGSAVQGYEAITCEVGTLAQPADTQILASEGDTVEITVEVPAGQPAMPNGGTSAARAKGWFFPLRRGPQ